MTCVPATLTAVSRFWSMPAEHLEVAEAICYDGTPDHSERHWAEEHGWLAREFTVTWESAVALLDRGVPFTLTTSDPTSAHLQAVIGYDARRGTLLVRDPYNRHVGEFLADEMLHDLRANGPRGMALVPTASAALLEALELPDASLYDTHYGMQRALVRHDRDAARAFFEQLQASAPDHPVTLRARRSLASYDSDQVELLACAEQTLTRWPESQDALLLKLSCLRDLAGREERLALLEQACAMKEAHPVFRQHLVQELAPDAREVRRALQCLRRAIHAQPVDGGNIYLLARILWEQRRFEEGLALHRIAACLEDTNETFSQAYFFAARHLKQTETALQLLRSRFRHFGSRSGQPVRTLVWALGELNRTTEAFAALDEGLGRRPDDGELHLFAALETGRHGDFARAARHLDAATGKSPRVAWLRMAAELAILRGERGEALSLWRQVAEAEPLEIDGHRAVAQLLAETEGPTAARSYLDGITVRFPHHYRLRQLQVEWLRDADSEEAEAAVRALVAIHPADAWARQELALELCRQRRFDDAFAESAIAGELAPTSPYRFSVHGQVCVGAGRMAEAREAFRHAIVLSADTEYAIRALVQVCDTPAQRREALAFLQTELVRQTLLGDGLLAFRDVAKEVLDPEELLASLRAAHAARPDLWHAWSALSRQLHEMGRGDEALAVAHEATERFPLLPRLWLDLALVLEGRREREAQVAALRQALQVDPGSSEALVQLASAHVSAGELPQAKELFEQAIARHPLDASGHGGLAHTLRKLGETEQALGALERALELEPGYVWAWDALREWPRELNLNGAGQERALAFARRLAERRPGEARSWLMLAHALSGEEALPEQLDAVERALSLVPHLIEAYELKAELLASAGRFEEALAACRPQFWQEDLPSPLRARAAWVEAARGDAQAAITQLRALLADDPHSFRGWSDLARLADACGEDAIYVEAAEQMVRLEPQEARAHATLADARLRSGDRAGAKASFRRTFDLDREFRPAGMMLFDEQLADGEVEEAAATLADVEETLRDEWSLARAVQLAVRRGQVDEAQLRLRELCVQPADDPWPYRTAVEAMAATGSGPAVTALLDEVVEQERANPNLGVLWVERRIACRDWKLERRLPALLKRGSVGARAAAAYLEALVENGRTVPARRFFKKYGPSLRCDLIAWGTVGSALLSLGEYRDALSWTDDWEERSGICPWMLHVRAFALRSVGRDAAAGEVSRQALTLESEDNSNGAHALWLAIDHLLAERAEEAGQLLGRINPEELPPFYHLLHAMACATATVKTISPAERQNALPHVKQALHGVKAPAIVVRSPAWRRAHHGLARQIAREIGGMPAALWARGRIAAAEVVAACT
jgi:tetratricopeptide (TPR) repeat protein